MNIFFHELLSNHNEACPCFHVCIQCSVPHKEGGGGGGGRSTPYTAQE